MAAATRDRILDAALVAFATRGVEGTPITDLEQAAGLAPGSGGFYRYFKTKDDALAEVVRREIDRIEARAHEVRPSELADRHGGVEAVLAATLANLRSLRPLMGILAREQGRIPVLAAEVSERLVEGGLRHDAAWLAEVMGADAEQARAVSAVVISALVGYSLSTDYFGAAPGGVGPDEFATTLAALLVDGDPP